MLSHVDMFHDCFDQVEDPRVSGRTTHPLNSILFLVVAATIADADGPEEIECFGNERVDWLSRFADFSEGIPSHDTIGRVLCLIKPEQFQKALLDWHTRLCEAHEGNRKTGDHCEAPVHVAIDGKTSRGSYTDSMKSNALHFVSAWASRHGVTLGQTEVDSKTNEITAIDELLDFIDVRQTIITLDAIGAQKKIAAKIASGSSDEIVKNSGHDPAAHAPAATAAQVQARKTIPASMVAVAATSVSR